ncbi:MAG: hypothetical protein HY319_21700 [Armatimonadetes bacterium]|nr:hypothetical protein [Armatimonadota bacterium]
MIFRRLLSDRLLLRELSSQSRRRYPRASWSYPGPAWFLVWALTLALAYWYWGFDASGAEVINPRVFLVTAGLLQLWLVAMRSIVYTSVSMAYEVRESTLPVLLSTPLSLVRALLAKLVACLLPLWLELALLLPFNLIFYVWIGGISATLALALNAFLFTVSLLFGGFGLWLGSIASDPEKAAGNARALAFMLLIGTLLLEKILAWWLLVIGVLIWICLVVQPQVRPRQAVHSGVIALLLLLSLPFVYKLTESRFHHFELSAYNPLRVVYTLANPKPAYHLVPDQIAAARAEAERTGNTVPVTLDQLTSAMTQEELLERALFHLLPTGAVYLLLAFVFFRLTVARARQYY